MSSFLLDYFYRIFFLYLFPYVDYILDKVLLIKIYFQSYYNLFFPPKTIDYVKLMIDDNKVGYLSSTQDLQWETFQPFSEACIEIRYLHNDNYYRAVYQYPDPIIFPPYSEEELNAYHQDHRYKNTILSAELWENGELEDVTEVLKEYMGPMNDFNKIDTKYLLNNSQQILKITDGLANDLEFTKNI